MELDVVVRGFRNVETEEPADRRAGTRTETSSSLRVSEQGDREDENFHSPKTPGIRPGEGEGGQSPLPQGVPRLRAYTPPRPGKGDAYACCKACHPELSARDLCGSGGGRGNLLLE